MKKTSTLIIGGGITGLTVAALLEKKGEDYVLLEALPELGGLIRSQSQEGVLLDYGLKTVPLEGPLNENPLIKLKALLGLDVAIDSFSSQPMTWGKHELASFVGFGEVKKRALIDELSYYTSAPRLLVSGGWGKLVDALKSIIPADKIVMQAEVTKLDLNVDRVSCVHYNGRESIEAERVIFTLSPSRLKHFVDNSYLTTRTQQRLAKTIPLTALSLDLVTTQKPTDLDNIFVFKDTVDEDFYVLGQFISNADTIRKSANYTVSHWVSLIDAELTNNDEEVSKYLRTMKKLIKRAFPNALENPKWERILVVPRAVAHFDQLQLESNSTVPGIENLYLIGAQTSGKSRNIINALSSALSVAAQIGKDIEETVAVEATPLSHEIPLPL